MEKLMTTSFIAIVAVMLSAGGIAHNAAFAATNPYVAGYPTTTTVTIHSQYTMNTNFTGVAGPRSQNLAHVFSTAGYSSTTATDPTGWIYQHGVDLHADDKIYGEQVVYNGSTCIWHCPISSSNWILLGHMGNANADIKYVYSTYFWNTGRTGVVFYYEPHFGDGSYSSAPIATYTKQVGVDTSNYFASGSKSKAVGGTTFLFKFFQFGIESNDPVNTAWNAKQYSMTYASTSPYASLTTASTTFKPSDPTNTSAITYSGSSAYGVGGSQYIANAHDHHNDSSIPSGTVQWYKSSTAITPGTQLWP